MGKLLLILMLCVLALAKKQGQDQVKHNDIHMPVSRFQELDKESNIIYSPAFRAAWTLLSEDILGEPVELKTAAPLSDILNQHPYHDCKETGWLTAAGFIENNIMSELDRKMHHLYGREAPGLENIRREREGILCYSYLDIKAPFSEDFEEFSWHFSAGDSAETVKCFGVSKGVNEEKTLIREQVRIYDYRNPDDFIIRITAVDPSLEVLISEMTPGDNIFETIKEIDRRINTSWADPLSGDDELIIPVVDLEHTHIYSELLGRYLLNKGYEKYFFATATQSISLSLDQGGAFAEISGRLLLKKGPVPRIYAIDHPFIVLIRKKGSEEPLVLARITDTHFLETVENN